MYSFAFLQQQSSEGPSSASDYVKELQRPPENLEALLKLLQSCRVSLTGRPLRYDATYCSTCCENSCDQC